MPPRPARPDRLALPRSPMPFGWVGCDAQLSASDFLTAAPESPMPFGWVGCDAQVARCLSR